MSKGGAYLRGFRPGSGMPWLGSVGRATVAGQKRRKKSRRESTERKQKSGSSEKVLQWVPKKKQKPVTSRPKRKFSPAQLKAQRAFAAKNRGRKGKAK